MVVAVKVTPRAKRSEIVGTMPDGTLKVRVAAVPEAGAANAELCRLLAAHFGVKQVTVISGQTGTRKMVKVGD